MYIERKYQQRKNNARLSSFTFSPFPCVIFQPSLPSSIVDVIPCVTLSSNQLMLYASNSLFRYICVSLCRIYIFSYYFLTIFTLFPMPGSHFRFYGGFLFFGQNKQPHLKNICSLIIHQRKLCDQNQNLQLLSGE